MCKVGIRFVGKVSDLKRGIHDQREKLIRDLSTVYNESRQDIPVEYLLKDYHEVCGGKADLESGEISVGMYLDMIQDLKDAYLLKLYSMDICSLLKEGYNCLAFVQESLDRNHGDITEKFRKDEDPSMDEVYKSLMTLDAELVD